MSYPHQTISDSELRTVFKKIEIKLHGSPSCKILWDIYIKIIAKLF